MFKPILFFPALAVVISLSTNITLADDQEQTQEQNQIQTRDRDQDRLRDQDMYGWQLMTLEERAEHRAMMRSLNTREEREAYRMEHHKRMQERAREKGVTLPDMPEPRGKGMMPRRDDMGPRGGGMGPGGGRGQ